MAGEQGPAINVPQVDHLILLVGGKPLPNAVAAKVLARPDTQISLLHSREGALIADRLNTWLTQHAGRQRAEPKEIREADPVSIINGTRERLAAGRGATIGLHYTGGTKAMSVHAYRAVEEWIRQRA